MTKTIEYVHTADVHNTKAAENFIPFVFRHIRPKSVIDIGCGTGTWLKIFKSYGVDEILGIDGSNVDLSHLEIPAENFRAHDLREPLQLKKKFDLAVCLEVAEHLPDANADALVELLVSTSDTILFSAALPGQGGQNHINEQRFSYWVEKFNRYGYIFLDVFRSEVWYIDNIDFWYRQNSFLVVKEENGVQQPILDFYHPEKVLGDVTHVNKLRSKMKALQEELKQYKYGKIPFGKAVRILLKSAKHSLLH